MSSHDRYHIEITRNGKTIRTTISLDKIVSRLLAVSLDETPGTRTAHTAVRLWLDKSLSEWSAFDAWLPVSRQATQLAILHIANPALVTKLDTMLSE